MVPWMNLDLDEEDSLSSRLGAQGGKAPLDVAVIRLPRISNFTDFDPLQRHPAVGLRYVDRAEELGRPDLVILPGTKSTLADLRWLRQCGLEAAILKLASRGTPVMGICGGYQMLGRKLSDPLGVEGGGSMDGMGLLDTTTVFSSEKTTTRTVCPFPECRGLFASLSGCPLEVHMLCFVSVFYNLFRIADHSIVLIRIIEIISFFIISDQKHTVLIGNPGKYFPAVF